MSPLRRLERAAVLVSGAAAVLGLLASVGVRLLPMVPAGALAWLSAALGILGAAGGAATVARGEEIDRRRWEIVADSQLTKGEREYAHREAERERRFAATAFFAAPVLLGYWMASQVDVSSAPLAVMQLGLPPLAGFAAGLGVAQLMSKRRRQ